MTSVQSFSIHDHNSAGVGRSRSVGDAVVGVSAAAQHPDVYCVAAKLAFLMTLAQRTVSDFT
jgi:hypothetical protein